jgi:hypothetical protein
MGRLCQSSYVGQALEERTRGSESIVKDFLSSPVNVPIDGFAVAYDCCAFRKAFGVIELCWDDNGPMLVDVPEVARPRHEGESVGKAFFLRIFGSDDHFAR